MWTIFTEIIVNKNFMYLGNEETQQNHAIGIELKFAIRLLLLISSELCHKGCHLNQLNFSN